MNSERKTINEFVHKLHTKVKFTVSKLKLHSDAYVVTDFEVDYNPSASQNGNESCMDITLK